MAKQFYCFLERFNNYFNRKIIKKETLEEYQDASDHFFIPFGAQGSGMLPFDFNPNDNVTTEIIVNEVPFAPDYFLLLNEDLTIASRWFVLEQKRNRQGQWLYQLKRDVVADNLDTLLDAPIFVEKGMLQQDDPFIVNDEGMNLNQIKKREWLIKDRSKTAWIVGYMAKNAGGSDINIQVDAETINVDYVTLGDIAQNMGTTEGILNSLINMNDDESNKAYFTNSLNIRVAKRQAHSARNLYQGFSFDISPELNSGTGSLIWTDDEASDYFFKQTEGSDDLFKTVFINGIASIASTLKNTLGGVFNRSYYLTYNQLQILNSYNGKYIKYNGEYYIFNIKFKENISSSKSAIKNDGTYTAISQISSAVISEASLTPDITLVGGPYTPSEPRGNILDKITTFETSVVISLSFVSVGDLIPQLNTTISSGRKVTGDQEYDIFAIPLNLRIRDNGNNYDTIEIHAKRIASAISLNQNAKVYDLQLLPYCPIPNLIIYENTIDISNLTDHQDYDLITKNISNVRQSYIYKSNMTFTPAGDGVWTATGSITLPVPTGKTLHITSVDPQFYPSQGEVSNFNYSTAGDTVSVNFTWTGNDPSDVWTTITIYISWYYSPDTSFSGIIFYVQNSTFSMNIPLDGDFYTFHSFPSDKKIASNCLSWRIVSPNYQGSFQFNIAKNGGRVESWNVFCTYKPFTPTIKVAPNFNWLYGSEFADNRGLLCAGDFSLPRVSDEWITYQLNNKNYQNIFNRDIQHLDFMQSIEMRNQLVSGGVGIFSDAVKGAGAGAMVGGGYGAIAGAVIGGTTSAIGYGIDIDTMARTHRENKQLAIDKFNYQLGNIKALPYTLTKVGSFDAISKIFPFVEYYSCSDKELEAFENKIKYESMTVMRIGTLSEFMNFDINLHYFKGSLIRNDKIADDPHILNAIYEELLKGVYI